MTRLLVLVLAVVALLAGTTLSARLDSGLLGPGPVSASVATAAEQSAFTDWLLASEGRKGDEPAYVAFRYYVAPHKKGDFVKIWHDLEDATKKEKGVVIFDLKKDMSDNTMFLGYGEWEDVKDYAEHYKSQYVQDFLKGMRDLDVGYTIIPLVAPQVTQVTPKKGDKTADDKLVHVVVRYLVPPSLHQDFEKLWDDAAKGTQEEEGSHIYSLRRVFNTNFQYYTYGTWDSWKDYHSHFDSDHIKQFLDEVDKREIMWNLNPLKKMGHQPE